MNRTIVQVPVSPTLRTRAEKTALEYGFSSLQEAIRIFMTKLAQKAIEVTFQESFKLSSKAEGRYERMDREFSAEKNIYLAETVDKLKTQLSG